MTLRPGETVDLSIDDVLRQFDPSNYREQYFHLLEQENRRVNLVSRETSDSELARLYAESLVPLTVLDPDSLPVALDIGSGGGFPAIPILLSDRVSSMTLVERIQKKASALQRMIIGLDRQTSATVYARPVGDLPPVGEYDLVTLRLVKPDQGLLGAAKRLLAPAGKLVYYGTLDESPPGFSMLSYSYRWTNGDTLRSVTLLQKS